MNELVYRLRNAIENYVKAEIAYQTTNQSDSMGTYYESDELEQAITELVSRLPIKVEDPRSDESDSFGDPL